MGSPALPPEGTKVTVDPASVEAEEFVAWLKEQGYEAEFDSLLGAAKVEADEHGEQSQALWDAYCGS